MIEEETTNPEVEVEEADTGYVESRDDIETRDNEDDSYESDDNELTIGDDDEDDSEEYDEVEFEGERLAVPKGSKIKEALMKNADYTRKTQEVAESRRAIEEQKAYVEQQQKEVEIDFEDRATLHMVEQRLKQFSEVNWAEVNETDPTMAAQLMMERQNLTELRTQKTQELSQRQQERSAKQSQEMAKLQQEGIKTLTTEIKGWNADKAKAVAEYIDTYKGLGLTEQALKDLDSGKYGAVPIIWAHKAKLYDQLLKKQAAKTPAEKPKPLKRLKGGKSSPTDFRSDMSHAEYDRWRARQSKRAKK